MPTVYPRELEHRANAPQMFDNDGGDQVIEVGRVQRPGVVNSVEYVPSWSISGANTNSRTYALINKRTDGTGTTTVATLLLTSGNNLTKGAAKTAVITAANAVVVVGDVLSWESIHVGNGLSDTGGLVIVQQSQTF